MAEYICDMTAMDDGSWDAVISEEIIRCRDCKHYNDYCPDDPRCDYFCVDMYECSVDPNGFCAWAERDA